MLSWSLQKSVAAHCRQPSQVAITGIDGGRNVPVDEYRLRVVLRRSQVTMVSHETSTRVLLVSAGKRMDHICPSLSTHKQTLKHAHMHICLTVSAIHKHIHTHTQQDQMHTWRIATTLHGQIQHTFPIEQSASTNRIKDWSRPGRQKEEGREGLGPCCNRLCLKHTDTHTHLTKSNNRSNPSQGKLQIVGLVLTRLLTQTHTNSMYMKC